MRHLLVALSILLCPLTPAHAQIAFNIELHGVDIGIHVATYPRLVRVPGYPVYYDPRANSNYFFYDGLYWVYQSDDWYASTWYNGPWQRVRPDDVPLYLLRVPVRYYRHPPSYFHGWRADAPPRWGEHWGHDWERSRAGWDQWDRRSVPAPAPLPAYQRQYSGERYPRAFEQQATILSQNYRYQPREAVTRQHYQEIQTQAAPSGARTQAREQPPVQQRAQPSRQQQAQPVPQQQVQPAPQQHAQPAPQQRGQPAPHQQAQPAPQQQAQPAPQQRGQPAARQQAQPAPQQHAQPAARQQAQPAPQQQAQPAARQQAQPAPQQQAQPAARQQAQPGQSSQAPGQARQDKPGASKGAENRAEPHGKGQGQDKNKEKEKDKKE